MKPQIPGKGRARIVSQTQDLLIEIPAKTNWFVTPFLGFWLCGWLMGELSVLGRLLSGGGNLFLLVWLGAWTVGGCMAMMVFLWNLGGKERVHVSPLGIRIDRSVPLWTRSRIYDGSHVERLRASPDGDPGKWLGQPSGGFLAGFDKGTVAFDYGRDTIRFGLDLDEADATHIVELMAPRLEKGLHGRG